MALNTIVLPYNKISEVEECEPVSSPSSTSFEENKTFPYLNSLYLPLFKTYNFPIELSVTKNKSSPPTLNHQNLNELFFGDNTERNYSKYNNNLNIEQLKNNLNSENYKDNSGFEKSLFKLDKNHTSRTNRNLFKNNFDNVDENLIENHGNPISYANLRENHRESDIIDNNKSNRIYDNYINNNPKINPVKEDKQIDSFMEEISNIENKIKDLKSIDSEEKINSINKTELPKINQKMNEINKIGISQSNNNRNINSNPLDIKNGIYIKKKNFRFKYKFWKKIKK